MKLVIAEKPSVAISIAKVIGATKKKDGYYEGNGYKVSWCVGHLIQMANPESYDEKYAKWNMADLPIIPREYKYEIAKSTKKQFTILKKLMNDKEIDIVMCIFLLSLSPVLSFLPYLRKKKIRSLKALRRKMMISFQRQKKAKMK